MFNLVYNVYFSIQHKAFLILLSLLSLDILLWDSNPGWLLCKYLRSSTLDNWTIETRDCYNIEGNSRATVLPVCANFCNIRTAKTLLCRNLSSHHSVGSTTSQP